MLVGFTHERLTKTVSTNSPYRGTLNRFPLGGRKQNLQNIFVENRNGQVEYDIVYGHDYVKHDITKDEYDLLKKIKSDVHVFNEGLPNESHHRYTTKNHVLGTVTPDGLFEFSNTGQYHQGDRQVMSRFCNGGFVTASRRGGLVYGYARDYHYPIFKGLKVDPVTMQSTKPVKMIGRRVNRKVGKELIKQYKNFYDVSEVMTKAMDGMTFLSTVKEVMVDHEVKDTLTSYWMSKDDEELLRSKADSLIDSAPLDAMILYSVLLDSNLRWQIRNDNPRMNGVEPYSIYVNLKRKLNKAIYKANPDVFKLVEYEWGKPVPASEWGYQLIVDGNEVEQYC